MKSSILLWLTVFATTITWAHAADVWGKPPEASDNRFSNPKSALYAGPDGWWNSGEVRATLTNSAKTPFGFNGSFTVITGSPTAVLDKQVLQFNFESETLPAPGVYQIGSVGNLAAKKVHVSFADMNSDQINEWSSADGAGTVTVTLVNGFLVFTCRDVSLQPSGLSNKGDLGSPMTLGFEGAMKQE